MKSSRSSTPEPSANGTKLLQTLKPRMQGIDRMIMQIPQMMQPLTRLTPVQSRNIARMFSNTARTVDNAAKVINRKNKDPQILPPAIFAKMFGRVTKIRLGPAPASTPKVEHAGKMIRPAMMATIVSRIITLMDSPIRERFLSR